LRSAIISILMLITLTGFCSAPASTSPSLPPASARELVQWTYLADSDAPPMAGPLEQTMMLSLDIDRDGRDDIVVGGRGRAPALVWLRYTASGWQRFLIEPESLSIEAGGAFADIDGDGDLDIVAGEDYSSNRVFWWENPYPHNDPNTGWTRRTIKSGGQNRHHDQVFGDFNGDGRMELAFWNQGNRNQPSILYIASIPPDPRQATLWSSTAIFTSTVYAEGLTAADIDGNGDVPIWKSSRAPVTGGGRLPCIAGQAPVGSVHRGSITTNRDWATLTVMATWIFLASRITSRRRA
jgi:hypothetical protein